MVFFADWILFWMFGEHVYTFDIDSLKSRTYNSRAANHVSSLQFIAIHGY